MMPAASNPDTAYTLLGKDDPDPVSVIRRDGSSRFVITCEHAGNQIPDSLNDLGLGDVDLNRHIAWDLGAEETAQGISDLIDAPLVLQRYSRLVIDCNRPTHSADSIPHDSDGTPVPGNFDISNEERDARYREVHLPFHDTVRELLDERIGQGEPPALISFHTFTPELSVEKIPRPWDMGLLYNRNARLAAVFDQVLEALEHDLVIAHNEPYSVGDETDFTLPVHGESRGIHNLLLEVRNDHLNDEAGIEKWSHFLGGVLQTVDQRLANAREDRP